MTPPRICLKARVEQGPPSQSHAGLWLDCYVAGKNGEERKPYMEKATGIEVPDGYSEWLATWESHLRKDPDTEVFHLITDGSRLVCGIGNASIWENGITLHRTWGVPVIPGSSLKGLAAAFASTALDDDRWERSRAKKGDSHAFLFGTIEQGGAVTFHDAVFVPGGGISSSPIGLDLDTITVHHRGYYGRGTAPPADWDSPVPIPFLTSSGCFLFALSGPEEWRRAAREILELALRNEGIGAKTSSGYGRMILERKLSSAEEDRHEIRSAVERFDFPRSDRDAGILEDLIRRIADQDSDAPDFAREMLDYLLARVPTAGDDKKHRKVARQCLHAVLGAEDRKTAEFLDRCLPEELRVQEQEGKDNPWLPKRVAELAPGSFEKTGLREFLVRHLSAHGPAGGGNHQGIASALVKKYKGLDKAGKKDLRRIVEELLWKKGRK